ncbi:hypothetical protein [Pseudomonas rhodesiae]|uniref:hypothetical protein n=1 Tax=Pseudomonas rhodesiae TaxID=76760 RepID=UPI00209E2795|nr:hypothetical protein [Pseudomonas rhodesiae]MCP1510961.1 hypothetical protein [Pseudomonas rhodesiae]MDF9769779.1 hypothetical protein [Pseudomonas rhodesiae]
MLDKSVPFKARALTPGFAPKEVEIIEVGYYAGYYTTAARKHYFHTDLYASKAQAIEAGWRKLDDQMNALKKRADAAARKKAMLAKHATKP